MMYRWAVCDGLKLTWMLGHKRVRLEVDSERVVKWIKLEESAHPQALNLVEKCQNLIFKEQEVELKHIYREQNRTANYMASTAIMNDKGLRA